MSAASSQERALASWSYVRTAVRNVIAIGVAAATGTIVWLVIAHVAQEAGATDVDFARDLGEQLGAADELKDIGTRAGLAAFGVSLGLTLLHAVVVARVVRGPLWARMLPVAVGSYLVWGLLAAPAKDVGAFGLSAGIDTAIVFAVSSVCFGFTVVRCQELMSRASWWRPREGAMAIGIAATLEGRASLELAEQGLEQRREGPGG